MATDAKSTGMLNVTFDDQEATELLQLLEHTLGETRVEVHRTHTPDYRTEVQRKEALLRSMIEKLRQARS